MTKKRIAALFAQATANEGFQVIAGTLAGLFIILPAVAISTLVLGAYGWGLFVLTPLVVGFTTGYLVNRRELQTKGTTYGLVLLSAALGCGGLILFALEGLICLILASPLAALLAIAGGSLGRRAAHAGKDPAAPFYCVALLPFMFAADALSPPEAMLLTNESIVISAPASRVWQALTSDDVIAEPPTLAGRFGLAYPERSHLSARQVGALRTGYFSTGMARERVIDWQENRLLAFMVLTQPPAMEEMSPYRIVHAPHLSGYFETGETRLELEALPDRRTRLTVRAAHRLRLDPIVYWEPIAKWAIRDNERRVLRDIKAKAEAQRLTPAGGPR